MKTVRFVSRVIALSLIAGLPTVAFAQSAPAPAKVATAMANPHVTTLHPISVSTCNPKQTSYMSGGYTPAYYPGGRYWGWPSVYGYGYNYYQYPVQGNPTLSIDYTNATSAVMSDIEFGLIAKNQLVAEVRDKGTFSPGAEIKHQFGLNSNVFPLGTSIVHCIPLKITFSDGTKWRNPHLPALHQGIYGKPHY